MTLFRACLDLHAGQVKQIVGGSLDLREPDKLKTNFESLPSKRRGCPASTRILAGPDPGEINHNAHEIKESLLGFDGRGGPSLMSDFNGLPDSTTSNYHTERFPEAGESSSQLSWDMRTRSSPSRSPSYDPSEPAKYLDMNTSAHLGSSALISSLRTSGGSPSKIVAHGGTREPDKRSLIDIHHLTNHVPRRRLTVEQEQILLRRFAVQEYLSKREMEELAEKLKIPTSQLRTWFGNRRSKLKAAVRQKAKMEAGMGHLTDAELRSLSKRS
ncbi:hypothetical protein PtB15_11B257 [Puccinia triticina]|nr:hypothetical protein PtB15_11B257 [Puccinia triticina]